MAKQELGQVWTPQWLVELILDEVGYTVDNPQILRAAILEPSFGEGIFLLEITRRLLKAAENLGMDAHQKRLLLEANICGIEYDYDVLEITRKSLNALAAQAKIGQPAWRLLHRDALTFEEYGAFQWVVGNPPYIRVHDMDAAMRRHIADFAHGTGTTDLYVLFFELGLRALKSGGHLGYVTPNSFLRNTSQRSFRTQLVSERLLSHLIDFGSERVFADAATYAAVTILAKGSTASHFTYSKRTAAATYSTEVDYADLAPGEALVFAAADDADFLAQIAAKPRALGEVLGVQYGVATLRDRIYTNPQGVEPELTRPVVKASTYKGQPITAKIAFPYREVAGRLEVISETELASTFPGALAFFQSNEPELLARDRDKGSLWYAYGRSQGLPNIAKPKLTISHVVAPNQTQLKAHVLGAEVVVYSGLFITEVPGGLTLAEIKATLESEAFCRFVKVHGKDMGGGYKSFTAKTLKAFRID